MTEGLPFPAALFRLRPEYCFLLSFALREFEQFGDRNQHTTTDAANRQLLFRNQRVQHSFADADEPSSGCFAVEQNRPVHT